MWRKFNFYVSIVSISTATKFITSRIGYLLFASFSLLLPAYGQTIEWQVINRFRLFTDRADFERHENAARGHDSILATERALAAGAEEGWSRSQYTRVCLKKGGNEILGECRRDGLRESYLRPTGFPIRVRFERADLSAAQCLWTFKDDETGRSEARSGACNGFEHRIGATQRLAVSVANSARPETVLATTMISVRHVLIAGLGDSIASGEGNPDQPVQLSSERAICFDRFFSNKEYWRPSREGYALRTACPANSSEMTTDEERQAWSARSARWSSPACHRSLYSYQFRTALALAIKNSDMAVTFVPLGCSGATIAEGLLGSKKAREYYHGQTVVQSQLSLVDRYRLDAGKPFDAVLLTIGANDIGFSGLVADIILQPGKDRDVFQKAGLITNVEQANKAIGSVLLPDFKRLRPRLTRVVKDGDLTNVIYTLYGNPAKAGAGSACPASRRGFDIHPGFGVDGERASQAVKFVDGTFFPVVKNLATCQASAGCKVPSRDSMTFVDAHQNAFAQHGFCAQAVTDPAFDRNCFRNDGQSFTLPQPQDSSALSGACKGREHEFRAYRTRQRWVRTANDSYFSAMTFPDEFRRLAVDLHDPIWGATSAVYGGAIHPTAEGHAAMADAVLQALSSRLKAKGWE